MKKNLKAFFEKVSVFKKINVNLRTFYTLLLACNA
jgi:hypothetical protein